MVTVILANLRRFVQHSALLALLLVFTLVFPALAQSEASGPPPGQTPVADEPAYIAGEVTEILSETSVQDEAFGREEKKFKFKVHFPAKDGDPEETVLLEQSYSPDTARELMPVKGKHFIFYKETMADGTHAYTLIDVQRLNHVPLIALAVIVLLILLGRWYGIKALLISAAMLASFMLLQLLKFPWMLNSILTFAIVAAVACLLTFGSGPRFLASYIASILGGVLTLSLVWIGGLLSISSPSVLLGSGMILQMAAGLSYIATSTVTAIHLSLRNEPGISKAGLYQKGLVGGRGSIEVVATLYLIISIGQILTSLYSQGGEPGLLQMEPILTEMASLLFMVLGFTLALPLSALVGARLLASRR